MKKVIIATIIASSAALAGCQAVTDQAATMVLGDQFIKANEKINNCDLSGLEYMKTAAADTNNTILSNAALVVLGSHYASTHQMHKVDTIAQTLADRSTSKSFAEARKELVDAGIKTGNDRVNNGFPITCNK